MNLFRILWKFFGKYDEVVAAGKCIQMRKRNNETYSCIATCTTYVLLLC